MGGEGGRGESLGPVFFLQDNILRDSSGAQYVTLVQDGQVSDVIRLASVPDHFGIRLDSYMSNDFGTGSPAPMIWNQMQKISDPTPQLPLFFAVMRIRIRLCGSGFV